MWTKAIQLIKYKCTRYTYKYVTKHFMRYRDKNIVHINLPNIYGNPIVEISFTLTSKIYIRIPSKRVYNSTRTKIISEKNNRLSIECSNESKLFLYSNFKNIQDGYYFPFISSTFYINNLEIKSDDNLRLEITIPSEFKFLSFLSFVKNLKKEIISYNECETWSNGTGTFYYPLYKKSSIKITMRAMGKGINYGLMHVILPILIFSIHGVFVFGDLPKSITDNSSNILIGVFLALLPFYIGVFQNYLTKSIMTLCIGSFFYLTSLFATFLFIILSSSNPCVANIVMFSTLSWALLLTLSIKKYFSNGKFGKFFDWILYKPYIALVRLRYRNTWKSQKKQTLGNTKYKQ